MSELHLNRKKTERKKKRTSDDNRLSKRSSSFVICQQNIDIGISLSHVAEAKRTIELLDFLLTFVFIIFGNIERIRNVCR